jgi:hypothetical protein
MMSNHEIALLRVVRSARGSKRSAARSGDRFNRESTPSKTGVGWGWGGKSAASTQSTSSQSFAARSEKLVAPQQQNGSRKSSVAAPQFLRRRMPEGPTPRGHVGQKEAAVPVAGHDRLRRQAPVAPDTPMNLNCPSVLAPERTRLAGSTAPETVGWSPQGQDRYPRVWIRHELTDRNDGRLARLAGRQKPRLVLNTQGRRA